MWGCGPQLVTICLRVSFHTALCYAVLPIYLKPNFDHLGFTTAMLCYDHQKYVQSIEAVLQPSHVLQC